MAKIGGGVLKGGLKKYHWYGTTLLLFILKTFTDRASALKNNNTSAHGFNHNYQQFQVVLSPKLDMVLASNTTN